MPNREEEEEEEDFGKPLLMQTDHPLKCCECGKSYLHLFRADFSERHTGNRRSSVFASGKVNVSPPSAHSVENVTLVFLCEMCRRPTMVAVQQHEGMSFITVQRP